MTNKIRTAILGMGVMGKRRRDAISRHGGFELVGTCDVVPGYDFTDWKECIDKTNPDAVFVCTINSVIPDIVCYAIEQGIHVFSEKPPGRNLADTLRMEDAYNTGNSILKFGFNHRYHNSIIEAKTLINSKLLGGVVCVRGIYGKAGNVDFTKEWRNNPELSGGGILLDQGIHMLDLMCWFLGDLTVEHGNVDRLVWRNMPTEDSAFAVLKTQDGKIASLHSSAIQWKHKFDMDIIFTDGYIALNGLLTGTRSYGEERITYYHKDLEIKDGKLGNPLEHTLCFDSDNSWDYETAEFFDAVRNGKPLVNGTIADAKRVMTLVESIYEQSR
ncbi:MAG: Gfo/Idh/MocA family oxidoreductase [Clostridiales bacterium]|jgi:predicted dehydrogenase|nr:Gfo/Idh/MocA family oxidoreductase [Clostridiales bacterium]